MLEVLAVCEMPQESEDAVHVSAVRTDVLLAGRKEQQVLDELDAHREDVQMSLDDQHGIQRSGDELLGAVGVSVRIDLLHGS